MGSPRTKGTSNDPETAAFFKRNEPEIFWIIRRIAETEFHQAAIGFDHRFECSERFFSSVAERLKPPSSLKAFASSAARPITALGVYQKG